jgi:hypothetical protein
MLLPLIACRINDLLASWELGPPTDFPAYFAARQEPISHAITRSSRLSSKWLLIFSHAMLRQNGREKTMTEHFRALVIDERDGKPAAGFRDLALADLPDQDVLVEVRFSTLNYKDGLAVSGKGRIARRLPMVAGVDLSGIVVESRNPDWKPGDKIIVNGWGMSETEWGGYTRFQRVKAEWLTRLPDAFTLEESMAIGTAGYTAALAIDALEAWGRIRTDQREILVTGAAGGVGSVAITLLAERGYKSPHRQEGRKPMTICRTLARPASSTGPNSPQRGQRFNGNAGRAPSIPSVPPRLPMFWRRPSRAVPSQPAALPAAPTFQQPSCRISCAASP